MSSLFQYLLLFGIYFVGNSPVLSKLSTHCKENRKIFTEKHGVITSKSYDNHMCQWFIKGMSIKALMY